MTSESPQVDAVRRFWDWFTANAESLKALYSGSQFERLAGEMNRELDRVEPQLAWEMGAGKRKPYLLTISAEGNPRFREIADLMVDLAPDLGGWEFYSARPARPAPRAVRLPESGERFETSEWEFVPVERFERRGLDLVVVDDQLARSDREAALRAVSLYLDQLLGEDTVETWIGTLSVESRLAAHGKKSHKMTELPDYLLWVTHRETNPLRKLTDRVQ
jgi:hypothetical protein